MDPPSATTNDQSELCKWLWIHRQIIRTFTVSKNSTNDTITTTYKTRLICFILAIFTLTIYGMNTILLMVIPMSEIQVQLVLGL